MVTTIESLPPEILQQLSVHLSDDISNIRECTSVCSAWKRFFEQPLYSSITLYSFSQLLKLLETLQSREHLSHLVKEISFCFDLDYKETVKNSNIPLLFIHLPNLRCVDFLEGLGLRYLLEVLKANKLLQLRRIELPINEEDLDDYTACAFIMKNRLENLSIENPANRVFFDEEGTPQLELDENDVPLPNDSEESVRRRNEGSELFHRLFDVLDEFKHVNDLQLSTKVNNDDVDLLEQATKACPLLEKLEVESYMDPEANNIPRAVSDVVNRDVLPAHKVRQLTLRKKGALHYHLFTRYVISKFPALESLVIEGTFNPSFPSLHWNQLEFRELMEYIANIRYVSLQRIPLERSSIDTFRHLLEARKTVCSDMSFEFNYAEYEGQNMDQISLEIEGSHISTIIRYQKLAANLSPSDLIEQYGQYITSLRFWEVPVLLPGTTVDDLVILQPLRYCPKLNRLHIIGCNLSGFSLPNNLHQISRREKLGYLMISSCTFESISAFECLNELFPSIGYLGIRPSRSNNGPENSSSFNLHLRNMNIDSLTFATGGFFPIGRRKHKLLIKLTTEDSQGYFMYDISAKDFILKRVNQQDFKNLLENDENFMFDFQFKSVKSFTIQHLIWKLKTIELPL